MTRANMIKQHLLSEYGGFADARIKKVESGDTFIVDERRAKVYGSDCLVFAKVRGDGAVEVHLTRNVPIDADVAAAVALVGGTCTSDPANIRVAVVPPDAQALRTIATAIAAVVAPGRRYLVASYKYACPATSRALVRLATALERIPSVM